MTHKFAFTGAAALALAIALPQAPAFAQRAGTITAKRRFDATGMTPTSGFAGTKVRISGRGFRAGVQVFFGNARGKVINVTPSVITAIVPPNARTGNVSLRFGRHTRDAGSFQVQQAQLIQRFSPAGGPPGTRVEIRGSGFANGDEVLLAGRRLRVERVNPRSIVVVIPEGARTGSFMVQRPRGPTVTSRRAFKVSRPAPVITSMTPAAGPPGTRVRLQGRHVRGKRVRVTYGPRRNRPLRILNEGPGFVEVQVPKNASQSHYFFIRSPRGEARTQGRFQLTLAPRVARMTPTSGGPGTRVQIFGANFRAGDTVTLRNQPVRIVQLRPGVLTVEVPQNGATGSFIIRRGPMSIKTRPFRVIYAPVVSGMQPSAGPPGTIVKLRGRFLGDPRHRVRYGRKNAKIVARGPGFIDVEIPRNARNPRALFVRGSGGEARTVRKFDLRIRPSVARIAPTFGAPGTQVTIFGANFRQGDTITLAGQQVRIANLAPGRVGVVVPPNARSGRFVIHRGPYKLPSKRFEVLLAPVVRNISPNFGGPGTRVTINGQGFGRRAKVSYGGRNLAVLRRVGDSAIEVVVPRNVGNHPFVVRTRGGEATSQPFKFRVFPVVKDMRPRQGLPGTQVTIKGQRLRQAGAWMIGGQPVRIIDKRPRRVIIEVPANNNGGVLGWRAHGQTFDNKRLRFNAFRRPVMSTLSPQAGPAGSNVTIRGQHFPPNARVFFDRQPMKIVRKSRTEIVARIPNRARGVRPIFIESWGTRIKSPGTFQVIVPPRITGIAPGKVRAGGQFVVRGTGFDQRTPVSLAPVNRRLANQPARITAMVPGRRGGAQVQVPPNTPAGRYFVIVGSARSRQTLIVSPQFAPPVITGLAPRTIMAGGTFTLRGTGFDLRSQVRVGNTQARIVEMTRGGVTVQLAPNTPIGRAFVTVVSRGVEARSRAQLTIKAPFTIDRHKPLYGAAGSKIVIRGQNFSPGMRVFFGNQEMKVVNMDTTARGGQRIFAIIPSNARGRRPIFVEKNGARVRSPGLFEVR